MRSTGTPSEYINFSEELLAHDEQIYSDISMAVVESYLVLDALHAEARRLRKVGSDLLRRKATFPGWETCIPTAPLLLLRFGDRRSLPLLEKCLRELRHDSRTLRSCAVVYLSFKGTQLAFVRECVARSGRIALAEVVLLVEEIRKYTDLPGRYKNRLRIRYNSVERKRYLDMRVLCMLRLLRHNRRRSVLEYVDNWKRNESSELTSERDKLLLK